MITSDQVARASLMLNSVNSGTGSQELVRLMGDAAPIYIVSEESRETADPSSMRMPRLCIQFAIIASLLDSCAASCPSSWFSIASRRGAELSFCGKLQERFYRELLPLLGSEPQWRCTLEVVPRHRFQFEAGSAQGGPEFARSPANSVKTNRHLKRKRP